MNGYSQRKKPNRAFRRWLYAAAMLLLLLIGLLVWRRMGAEPLTDGGEKPALPVETEPPLSADTAELRVVQTPEPIPAPKGTGHYAPERKWELYRAVPKEGACLPGVGDLAVSAKLHACRFLSGSGEMLPDYDYGDIVPETAAVDDSYFADSVFIGNSLEQGFMLYAGLNTADIFATQSINLSNIHFTRVIPDENGNLLTLPEAMKRRQYAKVFVMLGVNELSYATKESFYDEYAALIDEIRETEPGAAIYLQSITPVTKRQSENSKVFNNERIRGFNEVIQQLAADKDAHYLYVYDALADETGCLPAGSSDDGIHPYSNYYPKWLTYLRAHTVVETKR